MKAPQQRIYGNILNVRGVSLTASTHGKHRARAVAQGGHRGAVAQHASRHGKQKDRTHRTPQTVEWSGGAQVKLLSSS